MTCHHNPSNYEINPADGSLWCFRCQPPRLIAPGAANQPRMTICDRCGEEIALAEANYAGPELPTWEGATLCNECYAAEVSP